MSTPLALLDAATHLDGLPKLGRKIRALAATAMAPRSEVLFVNLHPDDLLDWSSSPTIPRSPEWRAA